VNINQFTVFPAIDLYNGQVVRLQQGKRANRTNFNLKPEEAAGKWISEGADWLHVVNLDGAFGEDSKHNINALRRILLTVNGAVNVQFGGGVRDLSTIDFILSLGVSRVILGTAAVRQPRLMKAALQTFGAQKIILGVDARNSKVRIAGWEEKTSQAPETLIESFKPEGLSTVVFTNINRDGMGSGVDVRATETIAETTGLNVIASGGVASLKDVRLVKSAGLAGVIIGRALYENEFTLSEAIQC
jgi:phosphoribosylformimino-5-aminoimidazole carboxamide ribotide isomerase